MPIKSMVHFDYGLEGHMKTKKSSKKEAGVETLRVRYAELLRLRGEVHRLAGLCPDIDEPRPHTASRSAEAPSVVGWSQGCLGLSGG